MAYKDPQKQIDYMKAYRDRRRAEGIKLPPYGTYKSKEQSVIDARQWAIDNPEQAKRNRRRSQLKKKYGMTEADYDRMFMRQRGLCAMCSLPPAEGKVLAIDHDHDTGKIRGLLCGSCNTGLGLLKDSLEILYNGIDYLARHQSPI